MNAIQRFFFNIFLFCFGFGLLFFVKLNSFASENVATLSGVNGSEINPNFWIRCEVVFSYNPQNRTCVYQHGTRSALVYSLTNDLPSYYTEHVEDLHGGVSPSSCTLYPNWSSVQSVGDDSSGYVDCYYFDSGVPAFSDFSASGIPWFSDYSELVNYLVTGYLPEIPFDETLELDYFKVSPYGIWDYLTTNLQDTLSFDYKYDIGWSDSRISKVQLKIDSTRVTNSFESSSSPFKGGFKGSTYAQLDGDVVRLIATPYKADGSYGVSLYYSFTQENNSPLVNLWRKLFKNNHTDNTITIPYENTTVTQPVEGVGTVNNYKVNYNPVTNEYGDLNLYEVYYQPVVVYMPDTPQDVIDDTQEVVSDTYVTNNYYQTTKNINLGFDINFGDISTNDITDTFDSFGNFGNGFGSFINRLASWLQLLFPFLHPAVAASIVFVFGLIVSLAIIAIVLKIAGVIADIIPF